MTNRRGGGPGRLSYLSIQGETIVRHSWKDGKDLETPLPTQQLTCERCGWKAKAIIDQEAPPKTCICGGYLRA